MKCIWCNGGSNKNHAKDKEGKIYYYVCFKCVGFYIEQQNEHAKELLEEMMNNVSVSPTEVILLEDFMEFMKTREECGL